MGDTEQDHDVRTDTSDTQNTQAVHDENALKSGDRLVAFLKAEAEKQIARVRLFESRAQTMATFAGASGTLAAVLKPTTLQPASFVLLGITAFLTLIVIGLALYVHFNRDTKIIDAGYWKKVRDRIWQDEEEPMVYIFEFQSSYLSDISDAQKLVEQKSGYVTRLQWVLAFQLVMSVVTILSFAWLGASKKPDGANASHTQSVLSSASTRTAAPASTLGQSLKPGKNESGTADHPETTSLTTR